MERYVIRFSLALLVLTVLILRGPWKALAQDEAVRQQEQIQRRMEEREREREARFRLRDNLPPAGLALPELPGEAVPDGALCTEVRAIEVEGATLLPAALVRRITSAYAGRCLSLTDMDNLLRDLTNAYIARGYITARAFARPEKSAGDTLQVLIVEGKLEKILLRDGDSDDLMRIRMAFGLPVPPALLQLTLMLRPQNWGLRWAARR